MIPGPRRCKCTRSFGATASHQCGHVTACQSRCTPVSNLVRVYPGPQHLLRRGSPPRGPTLRHHQVCCAAVSHCHRVQSLARCAAIPPGFLAIIWSQCCLLRMGDRPASCQADKMAIASGQRAKEEDGQIAARSQDRGPVSVTHRFQPETQNTSEWILGTWCGNARRTMSQRVPNERAFSSDSYPTNLSTEWATWWDPRARLILEALPWLYVESFPYDSPLMFALACFEQFFHWQTLCVLNSLVPCSQSRSPRGFTGMNLSQPVFCQPSLSPDSHAPQYQSPVPMQKNKHHATTPNIPSVIDAGNERP